MREHGTYPIPASTLPVLYWPEDAHEYWPWHRINRRHRACGGWLYATPPSIGKHEGSGDVTCLQCATTVADIKPALGRPLTPTQRQALQADRPKPGPTPKPKRELKRHRPCADCGALLSRSDALRCRPCNDAYRTAKSLTMQLVALLGQSSPLHGPDIAVALGIPHENVRKLIRRARENGRPIACTRGSWYYLETGMV